MIYPTNSTDTESVLDDKFLYKTKLNNYNNTSRDIQLETYASCKFCSELSIMVSKPVPLKNKTNKDILIR
jgi:hypothetical protein